MAKMAKASNRLGQYIGVIIGRSRKAGEPNPELERAITTCKSSQCVDIVDATHFKPPIKLDKRTER